MPNRGKQICEVHKKGKEAYERANKHAIKQKGDVLGGKI